MKLRTLFIITAVVSLVYAVGLLVVPGVMCTLYGFGGTTVEKLLGRFFGIELLALGLIFWLGKDLSGVSARHLITGNLIATVVGFIVALAGTLLGTMNAFGWSSVLIYLLLALGFAYFQFMAQVK